MSEATENHDREAVTGPLYVHSRSYRVDIGAHVFPTDKYRRIVERLQAEDGLDGSRFVEPEPAGEDDILSVHERAWYEACRDGTLDARQLLRLELPWSRELFEASIRCVGGSILAAEHALRHGVGLHVGGGFHHAYADHGEGFCVFNDPAIAARRMIELHGLDRAAVIDTDLHHGNGTASIFMDDSRIATFSIHQDGIYPLDRPPSTLDIGLAPGTGDDAYLEKLREALPGFLDRQAPELVVWVAGADPFREDQLGSLRLSLDGLADRDRLVVRACERRSIPLVVVLAGGYARRVQDTVSIHVASLRIARRLWRDDAGLPTA